MGTLFKASIILPMQGPPLIDGALFLSSEGEIEWIGGWDEWLNHPGMASEVKVIDLGDGILFPGLINLHAHLSLNHLGGYFESGTTFTEWAQRAIFSIGATSPEQFRKSLREAVSQLWKNSGCTTVVDHTMAPDEAASFSTPSTVIPIRVIQCFEFGGVLAGMAPEKALTHTYAHINALTHPGDIVGLAPHAGYSVVERVLEAMWGKGEGAGEGCRLWSMHVGESEDEADYFERRDGVMWRWLKESAVSPVEPRGENIMGHLESLGFPPCGGGRFLMVHNNFPGDGMDRIGRMRGVKERIGMVHCPTSHSFFGHKNHPVMDWESNGWRWGIGTDSLATQTLGEEGGVLELDLMREIETLKRGLGERMGDYRILEHLTVEAGEMLGLQDRIGTLEAGKAGDFNFLGISRSENERLKVEGANEMAGKIFRDGRRNLMTWIGGGRLNE